MAESTFLIFYYYAITVLKILQVINNKISYDSKIR